MELILYRGISVTENEADEIINIIKTDGILESPNANWDPFIIKNIKSKLDEYLNFPKLSIDDTRPKTKWVKTKKGGYRQPLEGDKCMCFADKEGAMYYATIHNRNKTNTVPLLIEVVVDSDNVFIDGRDLLYSAFGLLEPNKMEKFQKQRDMLQSIYGSRIDKYLLKLINNPNSDRFAICDLAIQDEQIILDHYSNDLLVKARHGVKFRSSFMVAIPIKPELIKNVERIDGNYLVGTADITIQEILMR